MNTARTWTFEEALERTHRSRRQVLLGNGFSTAAHKAFRYDGILKAAEIDQRVRDIFTKAGTSNFEAAMTQLLARAQADPALTTSALSDIEELKAGLIRALRAVHPERPADLSGKYEHCEKFLAHFIGRRRPEKGRIYTTNYDLLLYWTVAREGGPDRVGPTNKLFYADDGFRLDWATKRPVPAFPYQQDGCAKNAQIVYLHGALHLYGAGESVVKLSYADTGDALCDQISARLDAGQFPIFVTEGSSELKKHAMTRRPGREGYNRYLTDAFKTFAASSKVKPGFDASLFTVGHGMGIEDDHLIDTIVEGSLPLLCLGAYTPAEADSFKAKGEMLTRRRAELAGKPPLEVLVFDTSDINIWGPPT